MLQGHRSHREEGGTFAAFDPKSLWVSLHGASEGSLSELSRKRVRRVLEVGVGGGGRAI